MSKKEILYELIKGVIAFSIAYGMMYVMMKYAK